MKFLNPGRIPADPERLEASRPAAAGTPATVSGSEAGGVSDSLPSESHAQLRSSEGARILLEKIDALEARLHACEQTIEWMEQQKFALVEEHAEDKRNIEDRLRRQIERQVAALSMEMERRQKEFASKQAKLLELLASELSKVRSIAEVGTQHRQSEAAGERPQRAAHARRRGIEAGAGAGLDFFDSDGDDAGPLPRDATTPHQRSRVGGEVEFWDWLESLPREPGDQPLMKDIDLGDLDIDEPR